MKARTRRKDRTGSKAARDQLLKASCSALVEQFELCRMREPIDAQFAPYYERFLRCDFRAIIRYRAERCREEDVATSFYEFLGRLVTLRFYEVADVILSNIEQRGAISWPSTSEAFNYWYNALRPLCEQARLFIRASHRLAGRKVREKLWRGYLLQPLQDARFSSLKGHPNEASLQVQENVRQQSVRRRAVQSLLEVSETENVEFVRSGLRGLGMDGSKLEKQVTRSYHLAQIKSFARLNLVTREVFFRLAKTKGNLGRGGFAFAPSQVARFFACRILGISESTSSHQAKTVAKN